MALVSTIETVWSDLDPALVTDAQGDIKKGLNLEAVKGSIDNILHTNRGERLWLPEFGSSLMDVLFEPISEETFANLASTLKEELTKWDDRIIINSIDYTGDPDSHQITLKMQFSARGYDSVFQYSTTIVGTG